MKILLKGIAASPGIAEGKARIVSNSKEVAKVSKGDILVAPFTTPLLAPAIWRSVAIVTDEGGVLSHAAIISREFNIPCVVGTKRATEVLQDNMEIVVDGDKGTVYERR